MHYPRAPASPAIDTVEYDAASFSGKGGNRNKMNSATAAKTKKNRIRIRRRRRHFRLLFLKKAMMMQMTWERASKRRRVSGEYHPC